MLVRDRYMTAWTEEDRDGVGASEIGRIVSPRQSLQDGSRRKSLDVVRPTGYAWGSYSHGTVIGIFPYQQGRPVVRCAVFDIVADHAAHFKAHRQLKTERIVV
jgi:hypothetical protein